MKGSRHRELTGIDLFNDTYDPWHFLMHSSLFDMFDSFHVQFNHLVDATLNDNQVNNFLKKMFC